jgi:hypothetical protein
MVRPAAGAAAVVAEGEAGGSGARDPVCASIVGRTGAEVLAQNQCVSPD